MAMTYLMCCHSVFKMRYVRGGNLDGEIEEVIRGYLYQNSQTTIKASWLGADGQSGIKNYWVAVGTSPSKYTGKWFQIWNIKIQIIDLKTCS